MQANFWKLLNDANFGFNCRDNSQNKSLHLIYDERQEVDFISKYSTYSFGNCFLNLDSQIENIDRYYDKAENFDKNERPFVEIVREEEIESVKKRYLNQKKRGRRKDDVKTIRSSRRSIFKQILHLCTRSRK